MFATVTHSRSNRHRVQKVPPRVSFIGGGSIIVLFSLLTTTTALIIRSHPSRAVYHIVVYHIVVLRSQITLPSMYYHKSLDLLITYYSHAPAAESDSPALAVILILTLPYDRLLRYWKILPWICGICTRYQRPHIKAVNIVAVE